MKSACFLPIVALLLLSCSGGSRSDGEGAPAEDRSAQTTVSEGAAQAFGSSDAQADAAFAGVIGRTLAQSTPAWPQHPRPPADAPNVLIWLLDDAGYAQLEPYGGLIRTPNINRVAERGLVYADFHSIPLCSPARAALLSGRNHHSIGFGSHVMSPGGFPGYNAEIPKSAASWVRILRDQGYATYAFGKWDQTRVTDASVAGPFESWPSGQGFERFYGFVGGEAHHFAPAMWSDHTPISPSDDNPDYFLTTDLADKAIEYIGGLRANAPGKPFLIYWSTGAVHAPHHAPEAYLDMYRGAFDEGWDEARERILARQIELGIVPEGTALSPKLDAIADWDSLPDTEKRLYARQMEAFAAQLTHADHEFGRILDMLERRGELDNTIIIITSDNGASAEGGMAGLHNEGLSLNSEAATVESNMRFFDKWGGPETVNHYHAGWAMAGNTPFPYFKHQTEGGGTHVPFIVSWPRGVKERGVRRQYHHVIDIGPTVMDALKIEMPESIDGAPQKPMEGVSIAYSFDDPSAASKRTRQYYEIWGNRGIYLDGWKASTIHNNIMPWQRPDPGDLNADTWRLYNVREDFSQSRDLASRMPAKLNELQAAWELEAQKYGVYPIDPDRRARFIAQMNASGPKEDVLEYFPEGVVRVPEALSPPVKRKSFAIRAEIDSDNGAGVQGVIAAAGGVTGGYAFYVKDGRPTFVHNLYNESHYFVRSEKALPDGRSTLEFRFAKDPEGLGGFGQIFINDEKTGEARIPETVRNSFSIEEGFDLGMDEGTAVTDDYRPPFAFTGELNKVTFDLRQPSVSE